MKRTPLNTEFDSPEMSPGFLLWQVSNKWQAEQRNALAGYDLTHVQFVLLASLVWGADGKALSQKELAARAQTDVMMTSQVVRVLESKGLLTRVQSAIDKRSFVLRPTKKGVVLANETVTVVEAVDRRFFSILSGDVNSFTGMMQKLSIEG
jgi:DNA-binding MarR family transcriptional regulator